MPSGKQAIEAYIAACNATDPQTRMNLLQQAFTQDALVVYPNTEARGWEEVSAAIARIQEQVPGVRFIFTSGVEEHHGWLRVTWRITDSNGTAIREGEDVGEVGSDGRFTRMLGFSDPPPTFG